MMLQYRLCQLRVKLEYWLLRKLMRQKIRIILIEEPGHHQVMLQIPRGPNPFVTMFFKIDKSYEILGPAKVYCLTHEDRAHRD